MPSPTMNQKLITTKFLGKCWFGGHPWIRLAMDCERNGGKEINFTFCLGTTYDVSSMENIGNSRSFSLTGKACLSKYFISLISALSSGTSANICFPLRRAYLFIFMQFLFLFWVSIFSYKEPTREHYCHTCALDVANIWMCFMNGSMIEHNGLGITFFSVDILKDMVAC